jgi:uncharacterized protein YciI
MPQWLVTIRNATDQGMLERRAEVRPAHLKNVTALAAAGQIVAGGALLDEAVDVSGTVAVVDFPNRAELDEWLRSDP